ncbi:hypothetical protein [Prochlorococcus sp. MIT 1223]|uniref:hypothetical protein n=1 Tax=Prochlorococcus sp. MIT 1223 TaxID=3096217 RepID=UPI002A76117D|nr:hypothetical protein [Prochlorococcus sp. MIT 1223]
MSKNLTKSIDPNEISQNKSHGLASMVDPQNILALLPPGSFATIENQPNDLPPFQVISCKGGRCWVRQQSWGRYVHWEVPHNRLKSA